MARFTTVPARDAALAAAVARAVAALDARLTLVGLAGSALMDAGAVGGLRVLSEAFADRAYLADGSLAPRSVEGALVHEPALVADRAVRIVRDGRVRSLDGRTDVLVRADTLCIHGDTPGAAHVARAVRAALQREGIQVSAPDE